MQMKSAIATSTQQTITIRGNDLVNEIMGRRSVTEMLYMLLTGRWPQREDVVILDACLVALAEHGMTPSAVIARLVYQSVPDEKQAAIAAGLLAVGSVFVGTMEGAARLASEGVKAADQAAFCRETVADYRKRKKSMPGFGHPYHKPDDPRAKRLLDLANEVGRSGRYVKVLQALSQELDTAAGRHITINVTGAMGALLLEIGIPVEGIRGIAVVSRCVGLVGHIVEETNNPIAAGLNNLVNDHVQYDGIVK